MSSLSTRVKNGAKLLDAKHKNWFRKIDIDKLRMVHCYKCVLGQLYGNMANGTARLKIWNKTEEYGFYLVDDNMEMWDLLQKLWIKEINDRLEK